MKKIFTLALLVFSLTGFSQTFQRVDKQTQIVKRECQIIVITTDSLVASNMRGLSKVFEEVGCYSSASKSQARMFWFDIELETAIQNALNPYLVKVD
jgi:hypothetical protein